MTSIQHFRQCLEYCKSSVTVNCCHHCCRLSHVVTIASVCVFAASSIIHEARTLSCIVIFPRTSMVPGISWGLASIGELEGCHWGWDCVLGLWVMWPL